MLAVFAPIFVAETKITFVYNFVCHRQFFGNFPKFFMILVFQNSGRQLSLEIIFMSLLSLLIFLNVKLLHMFLGILKNYFMIFKSKIIGIIFMFPFGLG